MIDQLQYIAPPCCTPIVCTTEESKHPSDGAGNFHLTGHFHAYDWGIGRWGAGAGAGVGVGGSFL